MDRLRRTLPPPTSLVIFEAAARHRNFTHAAEELGVSQAAVSRQVHILEDNLGVSLFARGSRPLTLTVEGLRLYDAVATGLRNIAALASELRRRVAAPGTVTVAASVAFTSLWLVPRVAAFRARHPEVVLRLIAADPYTDPSRGEADLAVRFGGGGWPGLDCAPLFDDLVFPVAAPGFFAGRAAPRDLEALAPEPLLHMEEIDPTWISWRTWFQRLGGVLPARPADAITFNAYPNMIHGAVDGQGVALGWAHLVWRDLQRGALARLTPLTLRPAERQHLTWPAARELSPEADLFRDWLIAEAAADTIAEADLPPPLA